MSALAEAVARAPHEPGVYFFLGAERELLYVGKAADLRRRLGDHARDAGRTSDLRRHVLLASVHSVHWELSPDEDAAAAREADLIVMLAPTLNASHSDQDPGRYLVVTTGRPLTSFRLTATPTGAGRAYGTFPHLAKGAFSHTAKRTKAGYTALLRLLFSSGSPERAAEVPQRIAAASPPMSFEMPVAQESWPLLHDFLSGRSVRLLPALLAATAAADIPAFTRAALARDVDTAREFFERGPRHLRQFRLRHGLRAGPVSAEAMTQLLFGELRETVGEFGPRPDTDAEMLVGRRTARRQQLRERLRG